ncbi:MAG: rubredoxin, partial [Flavisolibacter sp.]|nr:rubredoxin [Flavisolibacter sp.]
AFAAGKEALPNIVSSYTSAGIFTSDTWVREGVYKDIFSLFHYAPQLKINICDSTQSFVPFFNGHINWVSSPSLHFWYLYIRFPRTQKLYCWPDLVYTNDIPTVSKKVEQVIFSSGTQYFANKEADGDALYQQVKSKLSYVCKNKEQELKLHNFSLPYYEGFNKEENKWWLGIYRRDELFPASFLIDLCIICTETKIGQIYTTPWKSLIIKGTESPHRELWDYVLGQYRINVRHAANELNWQVEDEEGLLVKRHIIRHFDKEDVRTYGLCFAVQTKPTSSLFGSVIIRKQSTKNPHRLKSLERFDILYTKDFNPNESEVELFRENVEKEHLGTYLVALCKHYYQREKPKPLLPLTEKNNASQSATQPPSKIVYQCKHCFTVYDEQVGDEENGIAAGTSFRDLPSSYHCPLCDADKADFKAIEERRLKTQAL